MSRKVDRKKGRRQYAEMLIDIASGGVSDLLDFARSNASAEWMPEDEIEYWDLIEVKSESIRQMMESLTKVIKKKE